MSLMAIRSMRSRTTAPLSALLLALQVLAAGAVPLAHAREPETAPVRIEARHDASCVVLHDALRCMLCQYARSLSAAPRVPGLGARLGVPEVVPHPGAARVLLSPARPGPLSRAPPSNLS